MTSVTIPQSVTTIGESAFSGCHGLTSVTIPKGVTFIGKSAFSECKGVKSIVVDRDNPVYDSRKSCNAIIETATNTLIAGCTNSSIPNSITSIGEYAFFYCSGLTSVTIPNSVTSIGEYAFSNCDGLTSVSIPNSVTSIGRCAFRGCDGLASVAIPNSVTSIGEGAFHASPWFNNMKDGLIYYNNIAYEYKGEMPLGTTITIKDGTKTIGDYAFSGCRGLTSVTIPNSVTTIGEYAFWDCRGLTAVHCLCTYPPIIRICDDCDKILDCDDLLRGDYLVGEFETKIFPTLYVPRGSIEAYKNARGWKDFKNIVEEENGNEGNGENDEIFEVAEQNPSFPGGEKAQADWIRQNLRYPQSAKEKNIQARVLVQVVVNKDGSIVEPKVLRPVDPDLDKEAIRLISSMPKWIPGKSGGKEIRVRHMIPITFRLN